SKLDPESAKKLQELRAEMAKLAAPEVQNSQLGKDMLNDLQKMIDQAQQMKLLPMLTQEKQALKDAFQKMAQDPLQQLASRFQEGANPQQTPADLQDMKKMSDRLQKQLESFKDDMKELADARKQMRENPEEALARLEREMRRQQGRMTADDLKELKEFLKNMRQQLQEMAMKQNDLYEARHKVPDALLDALEKQQALLDKMLDPKLDDAKELQKKEKMRKA